MDDFREQFGRHIAALRRKKKLTQEELASRIGVAERTVRRIETGENAPGFDLLPLLGKALRVPVPQLFEFPDDH